MLHLYLGESEYEHSFIWRTFSAATSWLFCLTGLSGVWGHGQGGHSLRLEDGQGDDGDDGVKVGCDGDNFSEWYCLSPAEKEKKGGQEHQDDCQEDTHHHDLVERFTL